MYSNSIDKLIAELKKLPSVGTHTAERFVYYWLKRGKKPVTELMIALKTLIDTVKTCEVCYDFSDTTPCPICNDSKRDQTLLCVVAEPWDKAALEATGEFHGQYLILRGTIDGSDLAKISETKIKELLSKLEINPPTNRLKLPARNGFAVAKSGGEISEIVLALNPDLAGETTMLYLEREIKTIRPDITVTRLARGLPLGADLRYADEITLGAALKHRTKK